jgi:hypothetical protein
MTFLDIVTVIANPLGLKSRIALARRAIANWLDEPNVRITLVECAYGSRGYELADLASVGVRHIPVRARTLVWNKESLCNLGTAHLPGDAENVCMFDADILFRQPGWAAQIIHALALYPVIQPWASCYDLGPNDELMAVHKSFASVYHSGSPVAPNSDKWWKGDGGPYDYPHSGYAWSYTRDVLDRIGGLFEQGGMGSGDHHMALALAGKADWSIPGEIQNSYRAAIKQWESRALAHVNGKIGFLPLTIEHLWHGPKKARNYLGRWAMFIEHDFDPVTDIKRNSYGVIEFSGNKPDLERAFDRYLRARNEDSNTL